jgi:hypothetical protein
VVIAWSVDQLVAGAGESIYSRIRVRLERGIRETSIQRRVELVQIACSSLGYSSVLNDVRLVMITLTYLLRLLVVLHKSAHNP